MASPLCPHFDQLELSIQPTQTFTKGTGRHQATATPLQFTTRSTEWSTPPLPTTTDSETMVRPCLCHSCFCCHTWPRLKTLPSKPPWPTATKSFNSSTPPFRSPTNPLFNSPPCNAPLPRRAPNLSAAPKRPLP